MMKRILAVLLAALLCCAVASAETYSGVGSGINGALSVSVTLDEGKITAVDVSDNNETYGVGKTALEQLAQAVVAGQTAQVDLVSGATVSSAAFRVALRDALTQAGVYDTFAAAPAYEAPVEPLEDMQTDVAVIGAGLSGLMTAIEAANDGLSVTLLEKNTYPGGDTLIAVGWISGNGNRMQRAAGTEVTYGNYDPETAPLNYKMAVESGPALDAMMDYGVHFVDTTIASTSFYPGYEKGGGAAMEALAAKAEELGVRILYATPAVDLIEENGACVGVVAEQANGNRFSIRAKATVIAAGGYQQNKEAVAKYNPEYAGLMCSAMPGGTGDWLEWVPKFDIALYGMDAGLHMQPATVSTNRAIAFMVSPSVVVDATGKRFANENTSYNPVAKAAMAAGVQEMYLILSEDMKAKESVPGLTDSLVASGAGKVFSSIEAIAAEYGLEDLPETVKRYNQMAETGTDEDFGRTNFAPLEGDTFYVIKARPTTYASYGGILIDEDFHVQNESGASVPGLYAVGAASGSYLVLENAGASSPGLTAAMTSGWSLGNALAGEIAGE